MTQPLAKPCKATLRIASAQPHQAHAQIWTAMRALPVWTLTELATVATTEECSVNVLAVTRYVLTLQKAGIVQKAGEERRARKLQMWRLKRAFNTGPLPPRLLSAALVYDANNHAIIGEPQAQEAA